MTAGLLTVTLFTVAFSMVARRLSSTVVTAPMVFLALGSLLSLADQIDWDWIDDQVADCFAAEGRPGTETRFMIGILLLKQTYGLSDEGVWERWVHDPYFQYFTGVTFFQHEIDHERSGLSHWRGRLGDKLELLLAESLRVQH